MVTKQTRPTEEARRRLQRSRDTLANAARLTLGPLKEGNVARDREFDALNIPKSGRTVRKMAVAARRYWPSVNSQRAPSRPLGTKKAPR